MDVLEHIEHTNAFIKSLIKHIKPGGHLLINVPALNLFYSVYGLGKGNDHAFYHCQSCDVRYKYPGLTPQEENHFYAEEFVSYILYPSKITSRKNIIRIRLESKIKSNAVSGFTIYTNNPDIGMNFVYNGINNKPIDFTRFTEEYGVGMISKNCVVDPLMMKYVTAHNQKVAAYLTAKFGVTWKDDLPATPFGLQKQ